MFLALAETGARPGEVLALRWSDVDIDRRTLRIERAVSLGGQIKPTKTEAARIVRLTVPLAEARSRHGVGMSIASPLRPRFHRQRTCFRPEVVSPCKRR